MRGAFVVQLRKITSGSHLESRPLEGVVEEVDTGKQAKFLSENELIEFLRERLAYTDRSSEHVQGTNDLNDDRR